jgi:hypothetical protein
VRSKRNRNGKLLLLAHSLLLTTYFSLPIREHGNFGEPVDSGYTEFMDSHSDLDED